MIYCKLCQGKCKGGHTKEELDRLPTPGKDETYVYGKDSSGSLHIIALPGG